MFSIVVKIEGIENRKRSAGLLHIAMGFYLIVRAGDYYNLLKPDAGLTALPLFMIATLSLVYGFLRKKIDPNASYNYWLRSVQVLTFIVLGVVMIRIGRPMDYISLFIWAFLGILLMFSERRVFQDTVIYLDSQGIRIPGYYKEHLVPWEAISEVVVREDFITIFHKKQKYLQYRVLQDLSTLEVAKMNAFCKEKLVREEEQVGSKKQDA